MQCRCGPEAFFGQTYLRAIQGPEASQGWQGFRPSGWRLQLGQCTCSAYRAQAVHLGSSWCRMQCRIAPCLCAGASLCLWGGRTLWQGNKACCLSCPASWLRQGSHCPCLFQQLAKLAGNVVVATCGSASKESMLKKLGADTVINYATSDVAEVGQVYSQSLPPPYGTGEFLLLFGMREDFWQTAQLC